MEISNEDKEFLELYSDSIYEKPSVTVDAVILRLVDKDTNNYRKLPEKKLQVFLTNRKYPPFKDKYAVVGTFIDLNNELAQTMKLCVKNKVGLDNFYYEQLYTFGEKQRDPRTRVLSVSYMLLTNQSVLENGEWFDIDLKYGDMKVENLKNGYRTSRQVKLILTGKDVVLDNELIVKTEKRGIESASEVLVENSALAFDHVKIIYYALNRLRNKLEYTDIIFNLLNEKFTLTELKNSYEVILGEKLLDANFRRKTANLVLPLNEYTQDKGHRPSQLFMHNPNWNKENIVWLIMKKYFLDYIKTISIM